MMGHLQDCSCLHDPPGRASSLGRPNGNPVSYPVVNSEVELKQEDSGVT